MIVVQSHGNFRVLHPGHLRHLMAARALGDKLVVTLTADLYIVKDGGPIFPEALRHEMLMALRCVDECHIIDAPDALAAVQEVSPDIIAVGGEYRGRYPEQEAIEAFGVQVVFTDELRYSTSRLLTHNCAGDGRSFEPFRPGHR